MSVEVFGHTKDGWPVRIVTFSGGGVTARLMEWGATLVELRLDGVDHALTLGFDDFTTYETHSQHVGAIAGRFAGRIAGGFSQDGLRHETTRNNGAATLHGGQQGFGLSLWTLTYHGRDFAELLLTQPSGTDGFPGEVEAICRYEAKAGGLHLTLSATSDAPTICNLAQHSYFNLSGRQTIDDHSLRLEATKYTPLNEDLLPTGAIDDVQGEWDFREIRRIGSTQLDGHFVLARARRSAPALAATVRGGKLQMQVETTEPGLVVYTADKLPVCPGIKGQTLGPRAGICLESQLWPDAPNQSGFPSATLAPDVPYKQETFYRFSRI